MGEQTGISWTDKTWSPWRGCSKVSEGCRFCYADRESGRNPKVLGIWGPDGTRVVNADWRKPLKWSEIAEAEGRREKVFPSLCDPFEAFECQMSDHKGNLLFDDRDHETFMTDTRVRFFQLMRNSPCIDWLVLTKRPENVRSMWPYDYPDDVEKYKTTIPLSALVKKTRENVWIGTSIEDQETADKRIPELLKCRDLSPVLWLSVEPLLGEIDFSGGDWFCPECEAYLSSSRVTNEEKCDSCGFKVEFHNMLHGIDWAIIGCESAPGKKVGRLSLSNPAATASDWIESAARIVEQCRNAGVAVFVKQIPVNGKIETDPANFPPELQYQEFPTNRTAVPKS